MIVKNVGLALFVAALVALAMVQDIDLTRTPAVAEAPVASQPAEPAADAPADTPDPEPVTLTVPSVEGMSYSDALSALTDASFTVMVFDGTQHAKPAEEFVAASAEAYVTATEPEGGEHTDDTLIAVAVSWDRSGLPDAARRDPWWWPAHENALGTGTALVCGECHDESVCTNCHVGRANTYLQPGQASPGNEAQVSIPVGDVTRVRDAADRALSDSPGAASMRGLSSAAGSGVLLDVQAPSASVDVTKVMRTVAPEVFQAADKLRVLEIRFFEPDGRLPHLTVTLQRETWQGVDWGSVTDETLPDVVDAYKLTD